MTRNFLPLKLFFKRIPGIIILILFTIIGNSFGEGTKELMPDEGNPTRILLDPSSGRVPFALYSSRTDEGYRLFIHIENPATERIYFGMGQQRNNNNNSIESQITWRIHPPNNYNIEECSGLTPIKHTSPNPPDVGYISSYLEATSGPSVLNASGYDAILCQPTNGPGDYFMTFEATATRTFDYFDITVVDVSTTPPTVKSGRVFSKCWQIRNPNTAGGNYFTFHGKLFIYSNDGIVTKIDPNGMEGRDFAVSTNESGCYQIGPGWNAQQARQSQPGPNPHTYPQFPIFLNNPGEFDPNYGAYPDGTIGQLVTGSVSTQTFCNTGNVKFNFQTSPANAIGSVEIKLSLSTLVPPMVDRILVTNNIPGGSYTITWDGLDGVGNQVPSGSTFPFTLRYTNGLTHMPLWDVEKNVNGFIVNLVRPILVPALPDPAFYWDDTKTGVGGGSVTVPPGCTIPPATSCHAWGVNPYPGDWGDQKTINTWWYLVSNSVDNVSLTYKKNPGTLVPQLPPTQVCQGATISITVNTDPTSTQYNWVWAGGTKITSSPTTTLAFPFNATPGLSTISVNGVNNDCGAGPVTSIPINILEVPDLTTSLTQSTCSGVPFTIPLSSSPSATNYNWTVNFSDCSSNIQVCPTGNYSGTNLTGNLSVTNQTQGSVNYIITPINGICNGSAKTMVVAVNPLPTPLISGASNVCVNATGINYTAVNSALAFSWTVSPGGLITNGDATSQITVSWNSSGQQYVYLSTIDANGCSSSTPSVYPVTVHPLPIPTITSQAVPLCVNAPVTYSTEFGMTGYTWQALPDGVITGGGTSVITVTWPSEGPKSVSVTYTDGNNCQPASPSVLSNITVNPLPNLVTAPLSPLTICSGDPANIQLSSTNPGTELSTIFNWTAVIPANITPTSITPGTGNISQNFINTGTQIEDVVYTITPVSNGCFANPQDYTFTVKVNPHPAVVFPSTPANPQEVCSGSNTMIPVVLGANVTLPVVSYNWTVDAFDDLNNPTTAIGGFVTPGNGSSIPGENLVSTLLTPGSVKYHVTATFTANGIGCAGSSNTYSVTVGPSPTVVPSVTSQAICSQTATQQVNFTANVSPVTYEWHVTNSSGVSNFLTTGTSDFIPAQSTITTTGSSQGSITYQITPNYSGGGSFTCPGGVSNTTILVNPIPLTPVITGGTGPGSGHTECENQPGVNYSVPLVTGHTYNWTLTGDAGFTGQGSNAISVTWGPAGPATVLVTETDQTLTPNCSSTSSIYNITLTNRPVPTLTPLNPPAGICLGQSDTYTTESGMTNYTWIIPPGGTPTSGGTSTSPTVTVNWTTPGFKTIHVNYKNSIGCYGLDPGAATTIEVHPLPVTTITAPPAPYCQDYPSLYPFSVPPDGGSTFTWTILPAAGRTITPGSVSSNIQVLWTSPGTYTVSVTGVNNTTGCNATSTPFLPVTILAKPTVTLRSCFDMQTTLNAKPFLLKGGLPLGATGKYTIDLNGTPVTTFNPLAAGAGPHTIYYTYTNNDGCVASDQKPILVLPSNAGFNCGTTYTDTRETPSKNYKTVNINGKCWMQENLRYGATIPFTTPQTDDCIFNRYCLSTDDVNCSQFGGLYQWDELMQYDGVDRAQGFCPPGWHIPNETEWNALIQFISGNIGNGVAGSFLSDNTPSALFKAKASGVFYLNNIESFTGTTVKASLFWTSTFDAPTKKAVTRGLNNLDPSVSYYYGSKSDAMPVRCVKD